ncbi:MAG TPA: hypothetical protein VGI88_16230 [Verrucomicrobiae bacterium]
MNERRAFVTKALSVWAAVVFAAAWQLTFAPSAIGQEKSAEKYFALPLAGNAGGESHGKVVSRHGVPFVEEILPLANAGSAQVNIGVAVKRIFLLGMTDADKLPDRAQLDDPTFRSRSSLIRPATPARGWAEARDQSARFFVGEQVGQIRLNYADGSSQVFPLILGEGVWWGRAFYDYQEPFPTDVPLQKALASALRLYPPKPVEDGNYVAVIVPKPAPIRSITVENASAKRGTLLIAGITVESAQTNGIANAKALTPGDFSKEFQEFVRTKALRPEGEDEKGTERRLNNLRGALYSSDADYAGHVARSTPPGYSGPDISFQGTIFAEILANVYRHNVQDIANKIDANGMYHTSTRDAPSWGCYTGVGFYRTNLGRYYDASFSRDMGPSVEELTAAGYLDDATRCAEYSLRQARLYTTDPKLKFKDAVLPPHWGQLINRPSRGSFENDGHGLTTLFLYRLWQHLPNRQEWLRANWPDVKAAGDWVLWQLAHPEISGATNGLLHTTGEAASGGGYSVFADSICMNALQALAQMADSIGETNAAEQWQDCAGKMRQAISEHYIDNDPKYGRVWTLAYADWPHKSGVLGPLIIQSSFQGFLAENDSEWRAVNEATYQRLIDTYKPFGFYGQAMGYGQGFVTEAALLLDRMHDATTMLNWAAKEIYDPKFGFYIVPEGCEIDPTGRFWYRIGDLGNGVQEGEIVKTLRLVMGVDDTQPDRLQFCPRLPYGWSNIAVDKYPIVFEKSGKMEAAVLSYKLERDGKNMKLEISADKELGPVAMRLGPFEKQPAASSVRVNGEIPSGAAIQRSGDSWWVQWTMPVGPDTSPVRK